MLDPFGLFKYIAIAWSWWMDKLGAKWFWILMAAGILLALGLGCHETYG